MTGPPRTQTATASRMPTTLTSRETDPATAAPMVAAKERTARAKDRVRAKDRAKDKDRARDTA